MPDFYPLISSTEIDFESIYNQAPCGLLTLRADGTIVHINQTLLKWLDADVDDVIYKNFTELLDKGGKLYYQLFIHPSLRMKNEIKEISFQIVTNKCSFPCYFSASVFEGANDESLFTASVYKVADRKKYEEELLKRKKEADMEKEMKSAALNEVAFDQSHLVRAPLANILGLTNLLEDIDVNDDLKAVIKMLRNSATKLDAEIIKIADKLNS